KIFVLMTEKNEIYIESIVEAIRIGKDKEEEVMQKAMPFILCCFSVTLMVILSAIGATAGSVKTASSAAMVSNRSRDILTKAYLPILLSSAVIIYSIVMTIM